MHDQRAREEIARLEAQIEALTDALERCRKIALAAKLAAAAGAALVALMALGLLAFAAANLVGAIAAVVGGIVLYGSNASTWKQIEAALVEARALRRELIERLQLRVVEDAPTLD